LTFSEERAAHAYRDTEIPENCSTSSDSVSLMLSPDTDRQTSSRLLFHLNP
jgi:hypothetical protein